MITVKDFMETVDYQITEGSKYCWDCFGPNAFAIEYWDGSHTGKSVSLTFDTKTQVVYQMEAYDYSQEVAYRWTNPDFAKLHADEATHRKVNEKQAWDDVDYFDFENKEDMLTTSKRVFQEKGNV